MGFLPLPIAVIDDGHWAAVEKGPEAGSTLDLQAK